MEFVRARLEVAYLRLVQPADYAMGAHLAVVEQLRALNVRVVAANKHRLVVETAAIIVSLVAHFEKRDVFEEKQVLGGLAELDVGLVLNDLELEESDNGLEVEVDGLYQFLWRNLPWDVILDDGVLPTVNEVLDDCAYLVNGKVDFHLGLHDRELGRPRLDLVVHLLLHLSQRLQNNEECLLNELFWHFFCYFAHLSNDVVEFVQLWILVAFLVGPVLLVSSHEAFGPGAGLGAVLPLNYSNLLLQ